MPSLCCTTHVPTGALAVRSLAYSFNLITLSLSLSLSHTHIDYFCDFNCPIQLYNNVFQNTHTYASIYMHLSVPQYTMSYMCTLTERESEGGGGIFFGSQCVHELLQILIPSPCFSHERLTSIVAW